MQQCFDHFNYCVLNGFGWYPNVGYTSADWFLLNIYTIEELHCKAGRKAFYISCDTNSSCVALDNQEIDCPELDQLSGTDGNVRASYVTWLLSTKRSRLHKIDPKIAWFFMPLNVCIIFTVCNSMHQFLLLLSMADCRLLPIFWYYVLVSVDHLWIIERLW